MPLIFVRFYPEISLHTYALFYGIYNIGEKNSASSVFKKLIKMTKVPNKVLKQFKIKNKS